MVSRAHSAVSAGTAMALAMTRALSAVAPDIAWVNCLNTADPHARGQRARAAQRPPVGRAWLASGDAHQAVTLLGQAVSVADTSGDIEPAANARSGLARAQLQLGDPTAALAAISTRGEQPYPPEEPAVRLLEGLALLGLHRLEESVRAFTGALVAADALLAPEDRNVAALQARALALSGLAAVAGDPARAVEAGEAFVWARAVTSAAGVAADTRRLLDKIACHDRSGILAEIRTAQDP